MDIRVYVHYLLGLYYICSLWQLKFNNLKFLGLTTIWLRQLFKSAGIKALTEGLLDSWSKSL